MLPRFRFCEVATSGAFNVIKQLLITMTCAYTWTEQDREHLAVETPLHHLRDAVREGPEGHPGSGKGTCRYTIQEGGREETPEHDDEQGSGAFDEEKLRWALSQINNGQRHAFHFVLHSGRKLGGRLPKYVLPHRVQCNLTLALSQVSDIGGKFRIFQSVGSRPSRVRSARHGRLAGIRPWSNSYMYLMPVARPFNQSTSHILPPSPSSSSSTTMMFPAVRATTGRHALLSVRGSIPLSRALRPLSTAVNPSGDNFVRIVEVAPRDGLQNIPPPAIPTAVKKELVERLLNCGLRTVEVGSFVRPDRVPQMADTPQLLPSLPSLNAKVEGEPIHYPVLVPNMRGLEGLLALEEKEQSSRSGVPLTNEVAVFVSATEPFSMANNNATVEKVLSGLPNVIEKATANGYRVRGYVSCVMTDPYAGPTAPEDVVKVAQRLLDMGCYEVSLGDTTGEGNPKAWVSLWQALIDAGVPVEKMAAHCHDTFSMALPSILALLPLGLRIVDSSLAGLGGCPYSPGATGNVATEDVVYALHKLGFQTGVDLDKLVESGNWLSETIKVKNESKVGRAIGARQALRKAKAAKM
ncbi:hypothetical protein A1Q2_06418 [Trichosporon asahii var. asahii CBS 8904]|uniref:hydroxymethylglutaryl-CoA lyase n=1 Tax=Trichosporon asahii var. asahii (strain CBS 8904) TaxID=1220162 RepID=K1WC72_TRIAC|nr:hypothetical protein A1Q2_06418 [Trichosporon asahii var. asahii CBS 8904]